MKKGFSMIEMLFYIALLTILLIVVIQGVLLMVTSYRSVRVAEVIESSAVTAMDRMTRDIRSAKTTDPASIFNSSLGVLVINTGSSSPSQIKFDGSTSTLAVYEDSLYSGPLFSSEARVKSLIFRPIGPGPSAIKIELEIESGTSSTYQSKKFYETAIFKGSYL